MTRATASFPSTHWSMVLSAGRGESAAALERLAVATWPAAVAYLRARGLPAEEARDAAQDFYLWILESDFLARADPARGSFRGFLKRSLAHFAIDRERRARSAKRGGDRRFQGLFDRHGEPLELVDPRAEDPDRALDEEWRRGLVERALQALEHELERAGKHLTLALVRDRFRGAATADRAALAAAHGITVVDVKNHLARARARLRFHLRTAVLETVEGQAALDSELAWIFEPAAGRSQE